MIIIAFDFGVKNIGVAVGQKYTRTGTALNVISAKNGKPNWNIIKNLLKDWDPKVAVVGLPLNMDGSKQNITKESEKFARLLKNKFNILVEMHDERLTTIEAKTIIFNNSSIKKHKEKKIHALSAVIILESWLNKDQIHI